MGAFVTSLLCIFLFPFVLSVPSPQAGSSPSRINSNTFLFELKCTSTEFCGKARIAIQSAFNRLSSVLDMRTPVSTNFVFEDLCAENGKAACTTLGHASPVVFPVRITSTEFLGVSQDNVKVGLNPGAVYLVPQALIKQSSVSIPSFVSLATYDINASFNSKTDWWFSQDNVPMKQNQVDLELVVLHETLHGLGFGSTSFFSTNTWSNSLIPSYDAYGTINGNLQFKNPTIWDAFLKVTASEVTSTPVAWLRNFEIYNDAERGKVTSRTSEQEFLNNIFKNSTIAQDAQWRFTLATTPNTLEFVPITSMGGPSNLLPSSSRLPVETSLKKFELGSSLSHFSSTLGSVSGEFLMFRSTPTIALSQAAGFASTYMKSGIGSGTLLALQSFGYKVNGFNNGPSLAGEIVSLDLGIAGAFALRPIIYPGFLILFFMFFS